MRERSRRVVRKSMVRGEERMREKNSESTPSEIHGESTISHDHQVI